MPTLVNPMDAMKTFEPALQSGAIRVQPGEVDPNLFVHLDHPNGETRLTYARFKNGSLSALAIIIPTERYEGLPCFQVGYAVPQHLRKRGLGKDVARAAIAEFRAGMTRNGVNDLYIEAIVGKKNIASQRVAEALFGPPLKEASDKDSGEPIFQYVAKIEDIT